MIYSDKDKQRINKKIRAMRNKALQEQERKQLEERLNNLINLIKEYKPDKDTLEEISKMVEVRDGVDGKDGKDGRDGKDGKDGKDGVKGARGEKGERGEPGKKETIERVIVKEEELTPEEIVKRLESLRDEQRLDAKAIKNLDRYVSQKVEYFAGGGGITEEFANETYLRLDTTNDPLTGDLDFGGNDILDLGHIEFDTNHLVEPENIGAVYWNNQEETLDINVNSNVTLQVGQEVLFNVKNQTGSQINNGAFVMFAGTVGNSGRILIQEGIADGSLNPEYTMGLTTEDIVDGADGKVTWFGKVRGIDTTGTPVGETWNDGDILYASPTTAGALTKVEPNAPDRRIIVAAVVHAHTNGVLFVRPTWHPKIEELDNVDGSVAINGDRLVYDAVNEYWTPQAQSIKLIETSTTTATMSDTVDVHICNGSSNYILTLPTHVSGKEIRIINKNTGIITLSPTSGTIKGESTQVLYEWESLILLSDGTDWI